MKTVVFNSFEMTIPQSWQKISIQGIDSEIGGVVTDRGDTLIYDLGWFTFDPQSEDIKHQIDTGYLERWEPEFDGQVPDSLYVEKKKVLNKYERIELGCLIGKLIKPIPSLGKYSGVFIDSMSVMPSGVTSFGFYGESLSNDVQMEFLKAISTISFKDYCK